MKKITKIPFVIEVEGMLPAKISFRVIAENEEQAYEIYEKNPGVLNLIHAPKILPGKIIPKKITIRKYSSVIANWCKKFFN